MGLERRVNYKDDMLSLFPLEMKIKIKSKNEINQQKVNEVGLENEIISEMTRIQKITSEHMVESYKKSVHVQSFVGPMSLNCGTGILIIKMNF